MIRIVKNILFKSALIIILLHTFISHNHSDEMSEVAHFKLHQDNDSLIAILKIVFHESDDENLDNLIFVPYSFDKTQQNYNNFSLTSVENNISFKKHNITAFLKAYNCTYSKNFIVKINGQRGPPISLYT